VSRVMPISQVGEAQDFIAEGHSKGKIILEMDADSA